MKNLFDPATKDEINTRLDTLTPQSQCQWGTMTAAQALAHCSAALETATGDRNPPRVFIGRIFGPFIKSIVFKNDEPLRRNSQTAPSLIMSDERDLEKERKQLHIMIDRFCAAGPAGCTTHPHSFFGQMTPDQWAILQYKHLDHHLRQFGA